MDLTTEQKINQLEKDVSILKSYCDFNIKENFFLRAFIKENLSNIDDEKNYGIFMNIYTILKRFTWWISFLCRLFLNALGLMFFIFICKGLFFYTYNKISLLSYYPTNELGWSCNYKVIEIPIALKNHTCDFNYVQCSYLNKIVYIDPTSKNTFNTTHSLYNYAMKEMDKIRCTNYGTIIITSNGKVKNRIWIDSNTIVKNLSFYFNYTFTCDFTTSLQKIRTIADNPLVINQEILSTLNHNLYDDLLDEISKQCSN